MALRLTADDCERIGRVAEERELAGAGVRWLTAESATDGWALESGARLGHRRGSMSIGFDTGSNSGALLGTAAGMVDVISRMNVAIERARSRSA